MTQKILGTAIILGVIFGVIFAVKFSNVYFGVNLLEKTMQECIQFFHNDKEEGCRVACARVIKQEGLSSAPETITMSIRLGDPNSYVEAHISETIDFFGIWQYEYETTLRAEGAPPSRF